MNTYIVVENDRMENDTQMYKYETESTDIKEIIKIHLQHVFAEIGEEESADDMLEAHIDAIEGNDHNLEFQELRNGWSFVGECQDIFITDLSSL